MDDAILWDKFGENSIENHFWRTVQYVSRCGKAAILFSKKKFQLCQKKVEFIGFRLDEQGVKPISEFLSSIRDFPEFVNTLGWRRNVSSSISEASAKSLRSHSQVAKRRWRLSNCWACG